VCARVIDHGLIFHAWAWEIVVWQIAARAWQNAVRKWQNVVELFCEVEKESKSLDCCVVVINMVISQASVSGPVKSHWV